MTWQIRYQIENVVFFLTKPWNATETLRNYGGERYTGREKVDLFRDIANSLVNLNGQFLSITHASGDFTLWACNRESHRNLRHIPLLVTIDATYSCILELHILQPTSDLHAYILTDSTIRLRESITKTLQYALHDNRLLSGSGCYRFTYSCDQSPVHNLTPCYCLLFTLICVVSYAISNPMYPTVLAAPVYTDCPQIYKTWPGFKVHGIRLESSFQRGKKCVKAILS